LRSCPSAVKRNEMSTSNELRATCKMSGFVLVQVEMTLHD
jgi:hypothetical protein